MVRSKYFFDERSEMNEGSRVLAPEQDEESKTVLSEIDPDDSLVTRVVNAQIGLLQMLVTIIVKGRSSR